MRGGLEELRHVSLSSAAILDEQASCGRGERLALALARENINSLLEDAARGRVEVDVYDLPRDSQYHTTETSRYPTPHHRDQEVPHTTPPRPVGPHHITPPRPVGPTPPTPVGLTPPPRGEGGRQSWSELKRAALLLSLSHCLTLSLFLSVCLSLFLSFSLTPTLTLTLTLTLSLTLTLTLTLALALALPLPLTLSLSFSLALTLTLTLSLSVCQILPKGVVSVIGPASSPASVSTVSHICGEKEVSPSHALHTSNGCRL